MIYKNKKKKKKMKQRVVNGKELRDNKEGVRVGARQRRAKVGKFGFVIVHELEECERKRERERALLGTISITGWSREMCEYTVMGVCMYARLYVCIR